MRTRFVLSVIAQAAALAACDGAHLATAQKLPGMRAGKG
jgi:hypothetical protein